MNAAHNLRQAYGQADPDTVAEGIRWYAEAEAEVGRLAETYGLDRDRAAGLLAALSPRQWWQVNKRAAWMLAEAYLRHGQVPDKGLGLRPNVDKAVRILSGERPSPEVLGRDKAWHFYRNLVGDESAVTVDTWAGRIAGGRTAREVNPSGAKYEAVEDAYREVAAEVGLAPRDLQAVLWLHAQRTLRHRGWRKGHNNAD